MKPTHEEIDVNPTLLDAFGGTRAIRHGVLQRTLAAARDGDSWRVTAFGSRIEGKLPFAAPAAATLLALLHPAMAGALYVMVAWMWFVPDRRIEKVIAR